MAICQPEHGRSRFAAGNVLVNNELAPFTYADGNLDRLDAFATYFSTYLDINGGIIPALDSTNSVYPHLKGTFGPGLDPYTNIIIDVYQLDPEGWTNGQAFALAELTDGATYTNGFPQGSKYLGSFPVTNSVSFDLDLTGLDLGAGGITVTANYSADPPRTHRGQTQTSNFSNPIFFQVAPSRPTVTIAKSGSDVVLAWPFSAGLLTIQSTADLGSPSSWVALSPQPQVTHVGSEYQATITPTNGVAFFRLAP